MYSSRFAVPLVPAHDVVMKISVLLFIYCSDYNKKSSALFRELPVWSNATKSDPRAGYFKPFSIIFGGGQKEISDTRIRVTASPYTYCRGTPRN